MPYVRLVNGKFVRGSREDEAEFYRSLRKGWRGQRRRHAKAARKGRKRR